MMNLEDFARRADQLIELANRALASERHTDYGDWLDGALFAECRSAALSFLRNAFGDQHPYYTEFAQSVASNDRYHVQRGKGILTAAREEVADGWTVSTRGLVSGEIFGEFLEMAEYLLDQGYKDPAAVLIGGVLEEHLRQLAERKGIPITVSINGRSAPKKADALNAELTSVRAFGKLDQKMITAWLDLRNKAAHGRYSEYQREQVALMAQGVAQFIARVPLQ